MLISESAWEEMTCLFAPSLDKAAALLLFWHRLAIVGYTGVPGNEQVEADLLRLKALIVGKEV
ncbi:hypothetical protein VAJ41_28250 [Klebsiella pneumoniae]